MNSTKVLIVDDEAPARERLQRMLLNIEGIEVIGEAEDGLQAIEQIERLRPDLVLLDIQMPGLDGFGVLDALQDPPPIIFVTAYDEYALRAFEVSALDYLLKPYGQDRLEAAVSRARTVTFSKEAFDQRSGSLFESLVEQGRYLNRLALQDREKIRLLDVSEIDWIGIEGGVLLVTYAASPTWVISTPHTSSTSSPAFKSAKYFVLPPGDKVYACTAPALTRNGRDAT